MSKHDWSDSTTTDETTFHKAFNDFYNAGMRLVEAWDTDTFHADERYPLPEALRPPMSLDDWLMELSAHYGERRGDR